MKYIEMHSKELNILVEQTDRMTYPLIYRATINIQRHMEL
jgi:hypothetical protein